tara:strand:+ start:383 stop:604 length:222 start_codon:yes stop_codon:yes gene_type:complete
MRIYLQFDNGGRIWKDCSSSDEARGYVAGAAGAAEHCRLQVWVAVGQAGDPALQEGAWWRPEEWLERPPSPHP